MKKQKENREIQWKQVTIVLALLFLLSIGFLIKEDFKNKDLLEKYTDCQLKKELCVNIFNESLMEWKKCIFSFGTLYLNLTEEEINERVEKGEMFYKLNNTEVIN